MMSKKQSSEDSLNKLIAQSTISILYRGSLIQNHMKKLF